MPLANPKLTPSQDALLKSSYELGGHIQLVNPTEEEKSDLRLLIQQGYMKAVALIEAALLLKGWDYVERNHLEDALLIQQTHQIRTGLQNLSSQPVNEAQWREEMQASGIDVARIGRIQNALDLAGLL